MFDPLVEAWVVDTSLRKRIGKITKERMDKEKQKVIDELGDLYYRNLSEAHLAAFRRQEAEASKSDKL